MATRLSKEEGFSGLWEDLLIRSNFTFYSVTLDKVRKADKELTKVLTRAYGRFFTTMAVNFVGRYSGARNGPSLPQGWNAWTSLSPSWLRYKDNRDAPNLFYSGVTGATTFKRSGSGIDTVEGGENFRRYLMGLKPIDVEDAFGKLEIEYTFRTKRNKFTTRNIQGELNLAQQITNTQKTEFPEQLLITATVMPFTTLRGIRMDEWDIVDRIIAEIGDYEQWRKINATSFGRNGRPIRAIVGPSITKFMNEVSLPALKQFNETLK